MGEALDPDNHLLSRQRLRRLESEAIRDSILAVSDSLDRSLGGPPVPVEGKPDGTFAPTGPGQFRRSLYLMARRNYHPTLLGVFDQPNLTTHCTGRASSAVVLQPLTMLNDRFVLDQAERLAQRVRRLSGSDGPEALVDTAFRLTLGRLPRASEAAACVALLRRHSLAHLCHVLLNTSEFLYIP